MGFHDCVFPLYIYANMSGKKASSEVSQLFRLYNKYKSILSSRLGTSCSLMNVFLRLYEILNEMFYVMFMLMKLPRQCSASGKFAEAPSDGFCTINVKEGGFSSFLWSRNSIIDYACEPIKSLLWHFQKKRKIIWNIFYL